MAKPSNSKFPALSGKPAYEGKFIDRTPQCVAVSKSSHIMILL